MYFSYLSWTCLEGFTAAINKTRRVRLSESQVWTMIDKAFNEWKNDSSNDKYQRFVYFDGSINVARFFEILFEEGDDSVLKRGICDGLIEEYLNEK